MKIFFEWLDNLTKVKTKAVPITPKKEEIKASFRVAGISFDDRQKIIEKAVKYAINQGVIEAYNGYSNKEIKEDSIDVYEAEGFCANKIRLEPTEYEGKDAIEVYATFDDKVEHMVGYVPKDRVVEINGMIALANTGNYKVSCDADVIGGKYKTLDGNDKVVIEEENYGLSVVLKLEQVG